MDFSELYEKQYQYYMTGITRSYEFRVDALKKLKTALKNWESRIVQALFIDLHKHPTEAYMTEIGIVIKEIGFHEKHLKRWMKDKFVITPLAQFKSTCFISPEPYGSVLIASPWNYPIHLCLVPLVGAISAGNCAVLKPSAQTKATSKVLAKMIADTFPAEYITVAECSRKEADMLFDQSWDYIFFTGSADAAKKILTTAAKHLTPVSTELGGKSPAIVDMSANIKLAAKRIAFGKVLNAGQTCVAPDYLFIHESVKNEFVREYSNALNGFFPDDNHDDMVHIINKRHYERVKELLSDAGNIEIGGSFDDRICFIEPTLITDITPADRIMNEEIFGPILPVMTYTNINTVIEYITSRPKPLALYLFTESRNVEKKILSKCSFGGGCINDVIMQLATSYMPFGGVGLSGHGSYHGKKSFETFSHFRSIMRKANWIDLPMRYMPYKKLNDKIIKIFMK